MSAHEPHVVPLRTYIGVFLALMVGTYLTVEAARHDFGVFNTLIALAIAGTKATLVVLFFMHVKYSPRLTKLVVVGAIAWLALLVLGTLSDYYAPAVQPPLDPSLTEPAPAIQRQ